MATRMASCDCEGQSEPINGTMVRDKKKKKKQDKDQITNYASCHFLFLLCQKCLCARACVCVFLCLLVFLVYHCLTVYASL